jgi:hypothetical protein
MKRFIIAAALGAGLLVTPLFTSGAGAEPSKVGITFGKQYESCSTQVSRDEGHWSSELNPGDVNAALRENNCGKFVQVIAAGALKAP